MTKGLTWTASSPYGEGSLVSRCVRDSLGLRARGFPEGESFELWEGSRPAKKGPRGLEPFLQVQIPPSYSTSKLAGKSCARRRRGGKKWVDD